MPNGVRLMAPSWSAPEKNGRPPLSCRHFSFEQSKGSRDCCLSVCYVERGDAQSFFCAASVFMLIRWIFYCVNIFMNAMYHDSWANSSRGDERTNLPHVVAFRAFLPTEVVFRELGDANMQFMEVKHSSFHRSSNQLVKWHWKPPI